MMKKCFFAMAAMMVWCLASVATAFRPGAPAAPSSCPFIVKTFKTTLECRCRTGCTRIGVSYSPDVYPGNGSLPSIHRVRREFGDGIVVEDYPVMMQSHACLWRFCCKTWLMGELAPMMFGDRVNLTYWVGRFEVNRKKRANGVDKVGLRCAANDLPSYLVWNQ